MKKRFFLTILNITILAVFFCASVNPHITNAQTGTITLQSRNVSPSPNGNFNWEIKVNSPSISGSSQITIKVYEQVSLPQVPPVINQQNITISVLGGVYNSGSILLPNKTYVAEGVYTLNGVTQTTQSITTTTSQGTSPTTTPGDTNPTILNPTNPTVTQGGEGESYELLAPLPIFGKVFNASGKSFGDYLSIMFTFFVSFAGVLAVVMLIFGGIQYMSTDAVSGKSDGISKMEQAIWGLLIVLASYVILNTVNPNLVKFNFSIQGQSISIDEAMVDDTPHTATNGKFCSSRYQSGAPWTPPDDSAERGSLQNLGVTVNRSNCTTVGSTNCTSLKGLSNQAIQKLGQLKTACTAFRPGCQVVVTGGTECWLHSTTTAHLPGNSVVDIRDDTVVNYLATVSSVTKSKNRNWDIYKVTSGPLTGAVIVDEGDHLHVHNW